MPGSASIIVGGITVQALADAEFETTIYVLSVNGQQAVVTDGALAIPAAAQQISTASLANTNLAAIETWLSQGGAQDLAARALDAASAPPASAAAQQQSTQSALLNPAGTVISPAASTVPSNAISTLVPLPVPNVPPTLPAGSVPGVALTQGLGNLASNPVPSLRSVDFLDAGAYSTGFTSFIYMAIEVESIFSGGKFTQQIKGAQKLFPLGQNSQQQGFVAQNPRTSANLDTVRPATQTETQRGAVGSSVSSAAPDPQGAFFGAPGGAVNFQPTGLSQVLDRVGRAPIVADPSVSGRNVGDEFGFFDAPGDITDFSPAQRRPPTSDGQPVSLPQPALQNLGGGQDPQLTQRLADLRAQLAVAIRSNNLSQIARLDREIAALNAQLLRSQQGVNTGQPTQNIAKER